MGPRNKVDPRSFLSSFLTPFSINWKLKLKTSDRGGPLSSLLEYRRPNPVVCTLAFSEL